MKTYRDAMQYSDKNLGWCKPVTFTYRGKTAFIAQNEGDIVGLEIEGKDVISDKENVFRALANHLGIGPEQFGDDGATELTDIYDCLFDGEGVDTVEGPCRNCPWFEKCEAMDEQLGDDE